ncbi:putative sporulation protein YtxC [Clostridiaceae bacterium M8S5]|nr:putative sporulation protein YtxC [Clostridiaceae bacterium M8S5]
MEFLSIAFKENISNIDYILKNKIETKEFDQFCKTIDQIGDTYIYNFHTKNDNYDKNLISKFSENLSSGLLDVILKIYKNKIVQDRINFSCYYLDSIEKKSVYNKTNEIIDEDSLNQVSEIAQYRVMIKDRIRQFLQNSDYMIMEGFIKFRLRFFIDYIDNTIERAVEDYFMEKEFNEFVKILKYFVEIQEPKIDVINVVIENDGKYLLYDDKDQIINNDYLKEIVEEMSENDVNYDDLLISSLITIAPKKVIMHIDEHRKLDGIIKIINNVFEDKVEICREYNFCSSLINKLKGILIKEK